MKSLRFVSAEALVSNPQVARKSLRNVAHNLYPLLFKASYLLDQGEVIHDLLENWPLTEFNLGSLLGQTADHPGDIRSRACRTCLEACLRGLRDYVLNDSSVYSKRLRVVDLTGIKDVEVQLCKCKKSLGRWGRTRLLATLCLELLGEVQKQQPGSSGSGVGIDVLVNLFVTDGNYEAVAQALKMRRASPLKLRCVTFRADSLDRAKLFSVLRLAEPESLQKLEVVHNVRLQMEHLEGLLSHVGFSQLVSLTLPARTFDVHRLTAEEELVLASIGEKLSQMTHLTELSLAFSTLTGKLRKLLSPLRTPLRALELANCSLSYADMAFLANGLHSFHLEVLDLSGHSVVALYPSTFFKLLNQASQTLRVLSLEECSIEDSHVNRMIMGLIPCRKLQEFKFLGNPLTSRALKCLFRAFTELPKLKSIEFPVPKDCYPDGTSYPLDDSSLPNFDHQKYEEIARELQAILLQANRDDIKASTPLYGSYDPDIHETSNELGSFLLQSLKNALESFSTALQKME
ncbi:leucine-rich repeat-containing protein 14B [Ornithorhynchus anatinus]|uniref:Leucine-rich repeat-containing protein 14B n=1 Tax=Ornithorhynchus anatinus TaxID=9258 RepID=F7E186_ORNAN|nr:leucine-rich repeat-containing protein 14B [Ornithorhynchus anatinus]